MTARGGSPSEDHGPLPPDGQDVGPDFEKGLSRLKATAERGDRNAIPAFAALFAAKARPSARRITTARAARAR